MESKRYTALLNTVGRMASQTAFILQKHYPHAIVEEQEKGILNGSPEHILKSVFGYKEFKPLQKQVIQNVLRGCDTLAVMPTGGGKSLCYQIPALIFKGLTVVVSPLIALMQDQVSQLNAAGVSAAFLNSSLDWESYKAVQNQIKSGLVKLLYVSPEGLNTQRMTDLLHSEEVDVCCITIDEAHCISEWGHDFRPDYLEIASLRKQFPHAVCLALTATATPTVQQDIVRLLNLENPQVLVSSFNRENLFLEVRRRTNAEEQITEFLAEHKDESGIIYCFSRKQVDKVFLFLSKKHFSVTEYHAGLSDEERSKNQEDFIRGKKDIMVATVAFGMGINKPDVRFVLHATLPKSVEQYYQEIGRAGRDGQKAHALLLYSPQDKMKIRYFFDELADSRKAESLLQKMVQFAEGRKCRRKALLEYFGEMEFEDQDPSCCCDICAFGGEKISLADVTVPAQKLMSCILRTRERYGITYLTDILLGSKSERIIENGHNRLSTWGIGKELSKSSWIELCNKLVEEGYLFKSDDYGVLYVTATGRDALNSREQILLSITFDTKVRQKKTVIRRQALSIADKGGERIAENLRAWRRKTADEMNPQMSNVDVAIIIGANDVVNPDAIHDESSPIYGMPIVNAFECKTVFVLKRGKGTGFSGLENPLFTNRIE